VSVGTPLCDADRAPWLARIAACIDGWREQGSAVVVTRSALDRAYRDIVVGGRDGVRLFHFGRQPRSDRRPPRPLHAV
jgi:gluconokinase